MALASTDSRRLCVSKSSLTFVAEENDRFSVIQYITAKGHLNIGNVLHSFTSRLSSLFSANCVLSNNCVQKLLNRRRCGAHANSTGKLTMIFSVTWKRTTVKRFYISLR